MTAAPLDRAALQREAEEEKQARIRATEAEHKRRRASEVQLIQEKGAAGAQLQTEMDKWAKTSDGQNWKDIKSLLSTVHEVMCENSGWTPIKLSDLIVNPEAQQKKYWRKAILLCHPDKHQHASAEQQYRAERIFP